jgi:hypothetical protein
MAAIRYGLDGGTTADRILSLLHNLYFLSALVLYAGLAVLWVWILSFHAARARLSLRGIGFRGHATACGHLFGEAVLPRFRLRLDPLRPFSRCGLTELNPNSFIVC